MKRIASALMVVHFCSCVNAQAPVIIDHHCTDFSKIPAIWKEAAKSNLHIAYGHSSHGSQLISGMIGIYLQYGSFYAFYPDGPEGTLDLHDYFIKGVDLGNPNLYAWADSTREYLNNPANSHVNVIIWAWCGQLSLNSEADVEIYLELMVRLELDFPQVKFVYMTGHLDGTAADDVLNRNNEQIRSFCINNNKILFDFADIESYDPDGLVNYMELSASENCDYDSDNDGSRDANWAVQWCADNADDCYYTGDCAHSQALNCQQKGIAAWWLWARLAGWNGQVSAIPVSEITITGEGGASTITTQGGTLQLSVEILPSDAADTTVSWSVDNGTGQASVSSTGLVTAVTNGTVTAIATANDGSGITASYLITISNQEIPSGLKNISVEPSGITVSRSELTVQFPLNNISGTLALYNLQGMLLAEQSGSGNPVILNIAKLPAGLYFLVITGEAKKKTIKVMKPDL